MSYLTTDLGHNLSYVWKTILCVSLIVRGGARWCNKSSICILNIDESWLLNVGCMDGNILEAHFVPNFTVDNAIDDSSKRWNNALG